MCAWDKTLPVTSTNIVSIPTFHQANWMAIDDFFDYGHYNLTESLSGRHKPGQVGCMAVSADSTAETSAGSGNNICWDSKYGHMMLQLSGDGTLDDLSFGHTTAIFKYKSAAQAIPVGVWTRVQFDGSAYNALSDTFASPDYVFTPKTAGYFYASVNIAFTSPIAGGFHLRLGTYEYSVSIPYGTSSLDIKRWHSDHKHLEDAQSWLRLSVSGIFYLNPAVYSPGGLYSHIYHDWGIGCDVKCDDAITNLTAGAFSIHRVS